MAAYKQNVYPLDPTQLNYYFNQTRIPKKGKDVIFQDSEARHVLVIRRGRYYVFDALDRNGEFGTRIFFRGNVTCLQ